MATGKNPHISLGSAIELLTSTMRDPMNADVCAMRVGLAADRIDQELEACTTIAAKIKIAKSHPDFLRAGIKFLTHNQPPSDHMAMVKWLIACRCDFGQTGMRNLHKPSRYRLDGRIQIDRHTLLFDAVATVSNCLILALADLTQHKFRDANPKTGKQNWPAGPEDLLPDGPKDSLVGLEHWVAAPPLGYIIFKLVGSIALLNVPFAQEVFQSSHFTFALARPVQHLEEAVKFYNEGDSSSLARAHFFTNPVKTVFDFFATLGECDRPQFNLMIVTRGQWISPILARLATILSGLPMEWSKTRFQVQFLTAYANAKVDPVTGSGIVEFRRESLTELPFYDALEGAFDTMVGVRKVGCWNIPCSSASEVVHSRLCSGCDLIRFCSKKCQKEAWKPSTLPHKDVCAKIHFLRESLGAADWSLIWTPDFTYARFQIMCTTKKVDAEFVKEIENTISALRKSKSIFHEDIKRAGASQIDRLRWVEAQKAARQRLKNLVNDIGPESVTIIHRGAALSMVSRPAIGRGNAIVEEVELTEGMRLAESVP